LIAAAAVIVVSGAIVGGFLVFTGDSSPDPAGERAGAAATTAAPEASTAPSEDALASTHVPSTLPPPADPAAPAKIVGPDPDQANPFVLVDRGRRYLYSSGCCWDTFQIPVREMTERETGWGPMIDALPVPPAWALHGKTWGPDARRIAGRYVLYYTAGVKTEDNRQCIGTATADVPAGPFTPTPEPIVCQLERKGSIDPRTFVDADGTLWMHWKSDDNAEEDGTHASIFAQRLSEDGLTLVGERYEILTADQPWEGRIVEAPHMILVNGRYWMFYSGNWFNQPYYGIGVAECAGPAGPCTKPHSGPFLSTNAQGAGPGESSHFVDGDGIWMVYGPWAVEYEQVTPRPVALARLAFNDAGPYLAAF
jgi:Glycosyl hydrolases family 43